MSRSWKLITVWLLIATALFVAVQAMQHRAERSRFSFDAANGRIELKRAPDGHFYWPGRVNGVAVVFLVDTGATSTALPLALAQDAGLVLEGAVRSSTAGGVVAERLRVGVLPRLDSPLLGMDVISKLRLSQRDGVMTLEPMR